MAVITGTALKLMAKELLKKMAKKAVKATAKKVVKKAVKSVVKKKKVKGKDLAKKMLGGGEDKGGALIKSGGSSIIPSPAGKLSKTEEGGEIVKSGSKGAAELGLTKFMDSLNSIQTSVESVKLALNDNKDSALERIEDQRLLNAKLKKEDREAELEAKKPKKKKGPLSGAKDVAEGFLAKMARFAAMTLLGGLIAALMGGARDVILAFRIGIEAIKKGVPTLLKGVKALKAGIGKAFKVALRPFKALGNLVFKGFQALGNKLIGMVKGAFAWVKNTMKNIVKAGAKAFPKIANAINQGKTFAGNVINKGKDFVKGTISKGKNLVKNVAGKAGKFIKGVGSKAKGFIKGGVGKVGKFVSKLFGKNAAKAVAGPAGKTIFKSLAKGAKAIKIPVIGPLLVAVTSMLSGDPLSQTLFKTLGAAIGGGLGLFLGPIGMFVGEIIGEFIGDVLYEGFMGKNGWAGAGKKLKDKFMQIVKGGKVVLDWIGGGFSRFFKGFMEEHSFKLPWWVSGPIKKLTGLEIGKLPNILQLYNPMAMGPLLLKSFFPPGEGKEESAEIGSQKTNTDAEDVSESASYEDGGEEDTTVVVDGGGGDQAAAPASSGGESRIIPLSVDKLTLVNSQYELSSTAALYKV